MDRKDMRIAHLLSARLIDKTNRERDARWLSDGFERVAAGAAALAIVASDSVAANTRPMRPALIFMLVFILSSYSRARARAERLSLC